MRIFFSQTRKIVLDLSSLMLIGNPVPQFFGLPIALVLACHKLTGKHTEKHRTDCLYIERRFEPKAYNLSAHYSEFNAKKILTLEQTKKENDFFGNNSKFQRILAHLFIDNSNKTKHKHAKLASHIKTCASIRHLIAQQNVAYKLHLVHILFCMLKLCSYIL